MSRIEPTFRNEDLSTETSHFNGVIIMNVSDAFLRARGLYYYLLFIYLFVYLLICLLICLFIYLFIYLFIQYFKIYVCVHVCIYVCIYLLTVDLKQLVFFNLKVEGSQSLVF